MSTTMTETKMIVRPIGDRLVVRPDVSDEMSPGGIALPTSAQEMPTTGKVVAVGSGLLLHDGSRSVLEVHEGDRVAFNRLTGIEVDIEDETFLVLRESDILVVF